MQYYYENITFDLSNLIKCDISIIETLYFKSGNSCNQIDIKGFNPYSYFLKNIIDLIKPCCGKCNVYRISNIIKILEKYKHVLKASEKFIDILYKDLIDTVNNFFNSCC